MTNFEFIAKQFKAVYKDVNKKKDISESKKRDIFLLLLKFGILVDFETLDYLDTQEANSLTSMLGVNGLATNSTFYKSFKQMDEFSDFEIRVHQMFNYFFTYGLGSEVTDETFILNNDINEKDITKISKTFSLVSLVSKQELGEKVQSLVYSGIALDSQTVKKLYELSIELDLNFNAEKIKNREFNLFYLSNNPNEIFDADTFINVVFYRLTDSTMLVKNKSAYYMIENSGIDRLKKVADLFNSIQKNENSFGFSLEKATPHIRRHKKFLLVLRKAFKNCDEEFSKEVNIINKLIRKNKKKNIQSKFPISQKISDPNYEIKNLEEYLSNATLYQLVRYNNILFEKIRTHNQNDFIKIYKVRNGKSFLQNKESSKITSKELNVLISRLSEVTEAIGRNYTEKFNNTFFILPPKEVELAMPTSAKNFIGYVPEFSQVSIENGDNIGIYWTGKPHQHIDFDLHVKDILGKSYGWNQNYRGSFTYTGDMTSLNKEGFAAEYMKVNGSESALFEVYPYAGTGNSEYTFLIAPASHEKDTMLEPNKIKFFAKFKNAETVGFISASRKFVLTTQCVTNSRVPIHGLSEKLLKGLTISADSKFMLHDFIEAINANDRFAYSDEEYEIPEGMEILDFSLESLTQDTFTSAFGE